MYKLIQLRTSMLFIYCTIINRSLNNKLTKEWNKKCPPLTFHWQIYDCIVKIIGWIRFAKDKLLRAKIIKEKEWFKPAKQEKNV